MGSLALPPVGEVYLDAQCVIYSVEQHAVFAAFVTNDFTFRGVSGLNAAVLHDVLAAP